MQIKVGKRNAKCKLCKNIIEINEVRIGSNNWYHVQCYLKNPNNQSIQKLCQLDGVQTLKQQYPTKYSQVLLAFYRTQRQHQAEVTRQQQRYNQLFQNGKHNLLTVSQRKLSLYKVDKLKQILKFYYFKQNGRKEMLLQRIENCKSMMLYVQLTNIKSSLFGINNCNDTNQQLPTELCYIITSYAYRAVSGEYASHPQRETIVRIKQTLSIKLKFDEFIEECESNENESSASYNGDTTETSTDHDDIDDSILEIDDHDENCWQWNNLGVDAMDVDDEESSPSYSGCTTETSDATDHDQSWNDDDGCTSDDHDVESEPTENSTESIMQENESNSRQSSEKNEMQLNLNSKPNKMIRIIKSKVLMVISIFNRFQRKSSN